MGLYRAPEYWYDCRFDNYSIGVLMYELLVGDVDLLGETYNIEYPDMEDPDYQSKFQEPCRDLNKRLCDTIENATQSATGRGYIISKEAAVVHRDLKPSNIMIHNGGARIIDAGFAARLKYKSSEIAGCGLYRAPEYWYDCRFDNYSISHSQSPTTKLRRQYQRKQG